MEPTIPIFTIKLPQDAILTVDKLKAQWHGYAHQYFNPDQLNSIKTPIRRALDYNLACIKNPLSPVELDNWGWILNISRGSYPLGTFFGEYLRRFYDSSTRSDKTDSIINSLLANNASFEEKLDFLSQKPEDFSIFNSFYTRSARQIMSFFESTLLHKDENQTTAKRFKYMLRYVYNPDFVADSQNYVFTEIMSNLVKIEPDFKSLLAGILTTDRQRMDFIVATMHLLDKAEKVKQACSNPDTMEEFNKSSLKQANRVSETLNQHFKQLYPESYSRYQLFKNLDVELSLSEISAQLSTVEPIDAMELPTL